MTINTIGGNGNAIGQILVPRDSTRGWQKAASFFW